MATMNSVGVVKLQNFNNTDSHFCNLNLNQNNNHKCLPVITPHSDIIQNKKNGYGNRHDDGLVKKQCFIDFKKNGFEKPLNFNFNEIKGTDDTWNHSDKTDIKNNSTLTMHITAYQNSNECIQENVNEPVHNKATNFYKNDIVEKQNPFEFPRQQVGQVNDPEIMQFKAAQKLLSPYDPPPPPPPPPPPIISEEEFYSSLTDLQKNFFDNYKQKSDTTEKELFYVRQQLEDEKQWNANLLDGLPVNIQNDEHEIGCQNIEQELQKLKLKIAKMEKEFQDFQVFSQKKINELKFEVAKLKKEKALNDSRSKYVLDLYMPGFDDEFSSDSESGIEENPGTDEEYTEEPQNKRQRIDQKYDEETWKKIIEEFYVNNMSITKVKNRYRKIKNSYEIGRMRDYLTRNGTAFKKFYDIDTYVLDYFLDMREKLEEIHDRDLIDAALRAAAEYNLPTFKASDRWLGRFKKKYRIVSRKINCRITLAQMRNVGELEEEIQEFRSDIKEIIGDIPLEWIYNADQTGVKQELNFGRTLTFKGEKKVEALAQRINATTHSYTAQILINAAGHLILPVMVIFCEPNKPQIFEEQLEEFKNLKAESTKSGMMTSALGIKWFNEIFKPKTVGQHPVLIVDAWNGYAKAFEQDEDNIQHHILPPKSTGKAQPIDVFLIRPMKNFMRLLTCKARRHENFQVSDRKGMATILDLTLGQFAAPVFHQMIQYAWHAAGYLDEHPGQFITPTVFCFDSIEVNSTCSICDERAFIKCAHCFEFLCFHHFVRNLHRCYD